MANWADEVSELRKRAAWYRQMAEIGAADLSDWRRVFADHLDKAADQIERDHAAKPPPHGR